MRRRLAGTRAFRCTVRTARQGRELQRTVCRFSPRSLPQLISFPNKWLWQRRDPHNLTRNKFLAPVPRAAWYQNKNREFRPMRVQFWCLATEDKLRSNRDGEFLRCDGWCSWSRGRMQRDLRTACDYLASGGNNEDSVWNRKSYGFAG